MTKMAMFLAGLFLCTGLAIADEETTLFDKFKEVVDKAEPRGGVFFNVKNDTIQGIVEAKILSKDIKGWVLEGVAGYAVDHTVVVGIETDILAGLSTIPGVELTVPWLGFNVGYAVGYSFEDDLPAYGPVLNASVKF